MTQPHTRVSHEKGIKNISSYCYGLVSRVYYMLKKSKIEKGVCPHLPKKWVYINTYTYLFIILKSDEKINHKFLNGYLEERDGMEWRG